MRNTALFLLLVAGLCVSASQAANIIWVSDNKNTTNVPSDKGWVDLLKAQGYNVEYRGEGGTGTPGFQTWRTLDTAKIAALNAADLIIISRDIDSGSYDDSTTEITQWNSITKPILVLIGHFARNNRWLWLNTDLTNDAQPTMQAVKLDHPIFKGVTLDASNRVNFLTAIGSFASTTNPGNGTLIASRADNNQVWIVEWQQGQVYYPGSPQTAGSLRLLFCAGATGAGGPDGTYNLTAEGQKMFLNAVRYMLGESDLGLASGPVPADKATDVARDVVLGWKPGKYAAKHDVYFGTNSADVDSASRTTPKGVLVNQNQDPNTYDPAGLLEFGKTYYWRIDEVNAPPTSTVFKGAVWSFTTEPLTYQIKNITATASSFHNANTGPEKTVDGSGLNTNDQHGTLDTTMWLSSGTATGPAWIQYQFDRVCKLQEMWVWNANQSVEPFVGFGFKSVTIQYSTDGTNWTQLAGVADFAQGTGLTDYVHNTTVNFGGLAVKYVKITANSNWGTLKQYGLSEVRFFQTPAHAREPNPTSGQSGVPLDATLRWRAGREAATHKVYMSTSKKAVREGTVAPTSIAASGSAASYGPLSLELGKTYYWRVDEVNEAKTPSTWQGDVWSFNSLPYLVVDDFEDYNDSSPKRIFQTWIDGFGYSEPAPGNPGNGSGSTVGNINPPFAETRAGYFHAGRQAMPMDYNDARLPYYSEAVRTFTTAQDWGRTDVKALGIWFRGLPGMVGSLRYDAATKTYTMTGSGTDIWGTADQFHFAWKRLSGNGAIVAKVLSVTNSDPWAKAGVMIRATLDPNSTFAALYMTPANGCRYQARLTTAASAVSDSGVTQLATILVPHWIKIERTGNTFNAYDSNNPPAPDGTGTDTWHPLAWNPQTIQMGTDVYIGLAVTAHNAAAVCEAQFSNVSVTGTVTPAGIFTTSQDIGILTNDAEPLYVVLEDSAGKKKVVTHSDPNAILSSAYQEWNVPLKTFSDAGVNLKSIKKISLGTGNRASPTPGGSGELYFDDIRLYPARCVPTLLKPAGDITGDCAVDYADIRTLANQWLQTATPPATLSADLTTDNKVDLKDFSKLAQTWLEELLWP